MPDVQTQLKIYLDHVIERIEVEDLYVGTARPSHSPGVTRERLPDTPRWAFGVAACLLIAVFALLSWADASSDQTDPAASIPSTTTSPTTGLVPSQEDFTWRETHLTAEPGLPGSDSGPGYLDLIVGDGESFIVTATENPFYETWTSADGETWTLQPEYIRVIHGAAGLFLGIHQNETEGVGDDRLAISDDGVSWEYVTPATGESPHRFEEFRYVGLTVDEILTLDLPDVWNPHEDRREPPGTPSHVGAILKIDGRYVGYFYGNEDTASVMGAVSEDGLTWATFEAPDFLAEWLDIRNGRAISDRYLSERLWSSTFAGDGTRVLALVGNQSGHGIYESSDGIVWNRVETRYLETSPGDPFASSVGPDDLTLGLARLADGWVISSWWWPLSEEDFAILFSRDGRSWLPLEAPISREGLDWRPRVAGNTIFLHDGRADRAQILIGDYAR